MSDLVRDSAFRRTADDHQDPAVDRELASPGRNDEHDERDAVADHALFQGGDAGTKGTGSSG